MPTYEYRCKDCGASLEVVQSFSEPSLTECRTCGGRLRKVFGNVGISFKGSGFYRTDSRSGSGSKDSSKESSSKESSSKESSSADSSNGSKEADTKKDSSVDTSSKTKASESTSSSSSTSSS